MYLIYVDESGRKEDDMVIYSALLLPHNMWRDSFNLIRQWRYHLKKSYDIPVYYEIHANNFVAGRGRPGRRIITKYERSQIFSESLTLCTLLSGVQLVNVITPHNQKEQGFNYLLNRLNRALEEAENQAILICDSGQEYYYTRWMRKAYVFNPIPSAYGTWSNGKSYRNKPINQFIEDPFYRDSDSSYFIQLVDCCAYSLLMKEAPTANQKKYGLDSSFEILDPILNKAASKSDTHGIVRVKKNSPI